MCEALSQNLRGSAKGFRVGWLPASGSLIALLPDPGGDELMQPCGAEKVNALTQAFGSWECLVWSAVSFRIVWQVGYRVS